jgi:hypothetical protein
MPPGHKPEADAEVNAHSEKQGQHIGSPDKAADLAEQGLKGLNRHAASMPDCVSQNQHVDNLATDIDPDDPALYPF